VAERLDCSEQRRRLRALLLGESPPRAEIVAGDVSRKMHNLRRNPESNFMQPLDGFTR
jgi:hypothetical protein